MPYRLAIFETHPIQYKVPWFRALAAHPAIDLTVFYCMLPDARQQGVGFGVQFQWNTPLLEGYRYLVLENAAVDPGVTHFRGCDTPGIADYIAGRNGEIRPTDHADHTEVGSAHESTRMDTNGEEKREYYRKDGKLGNGGAETTGPQDHGTAGSQEHEATGSPDHGTMGAGIRRGGARLPHSAEPTTPAGRPTWEGLSEPRSGANCTPSAAALRAPVKSTPPSGLPASHFDAVIINGWVVKACLQALWACRRAGIPAILRCEACDLQPRAWWKTLVHRALLKQFSAFIAIGTANRNFYRRRGVPPERIVDGFYCVDNDRFQRVLQEGREGRDEARRTWGVPSDAVCFLFSGKFEPKKRPMDLLRALSALYSGEHGARSAEGRVAALSTEHTEDTEGEVNHERPETHDRGEEWSSCGKAGKSGKGAARPVHLLMVGDGELRAECEAYAKAHRLPVSFAGFVNQSEMPHAYVAADCLVLPSDHGETWGLVVNEAMACGLPAITSDRVGCHPDLILPGRTGSTFPCGDIEALAETMTRLASAPAALRAMGRNACEHIRRYSVTVLVEGTLAALKLVCAREV